MTAFFTFAYNADKTLDRTVNSVLNQTNPDWVYYLIDNGSTDYTRQIVKKYAENDSRFFPVYMDHNDPYEASRIGFSRIFNSDADYFCMVDADDEYYPEFLEKSLAFMEKQKLDVVAAGHDFIDAQTNKWLAVRKSDANIVLDSPVTYSDHFAYCYQFFRPIWGKLFKIKLFQPFDFTDENWDYYNVTYGGDTVFCLKALTYANRVGILGESLHKYYCSLKSSSNVYAPRRNHADVVLFDTAVEFIESKSGYVSPRNYEFLYLVYMNALIDTLHVLLNSELSVREKIDDVCEMFLCDHAKKLMSYDNLEMYNGCPDDNTRRLYLFSCAVLWLVSVKDCDASQAEKYCEVGELLSAAIENAKTWIFFKKTLVQYYIAHGRIDEAQPKLDELLELVPDDQELTRMQSELNDKTMIILRIVGAS